jgi:hypothetical protein
MIASRRHIDLFIHCSNPGASVSDHSQQRGPRLRLCLRTANGAFFHRWQHVRSFDRTNLTGTLKSFGLHEVLIHEIDFRPEAFNAMNETITNAGVTNPFALMRPVIMGAQPNLAGIFSTEQRKFKIDKRPHHPMGPIRCSNGRRYEIRIASAKQRPNSESA